MVERIVSILEGIKQKSPLIHHITNYVTVNDCANIALAIGASPVMAQDINEVEDMVSIASSLVINIGTLSSDTVEAMILAGKKAKKMGIPVVFDPVGVGATPYRNDVAIRILKEVKPDVIRGNASEIKCLSGFGGKTKGVDSTDDSSEIEKFALELVEKTNGIIAITGKRDIIIDSNQKVYIENGDFLLTKVTGTGCMTTSLVGCGVAVGDSFWGTVAGVCFMGIAGEIAKETLKSREGLGSYRVKLMDAISNIDDNIIKNFLKIS